MPPPTPEPLPFLKGVAPYQSTSNSVEADGFAHRLCYNESPFGPSPKTIAALRDHLNIANRYPDDMGYSRLRETVARHFSLDASRLVCGCGSDELIGLLVSSHMKPGDEAVISQYAFSLFEIAVRNVGGASVFAPEKDLRMDLDAMLKAVTPKTRIVFIANPNNPTGDCLPRGAIEAFLKRLPPDILFVYDAAYADYIDEGEYSNGFEWVKDDGRVVVLRTFSKAHGLAGLRVGYAYGPKSVIDAINVIRKPFNVSNLGEIAATASLDDGLFIAQNRAHNAVWRDRLMDELRRHGAKPYDSAGNFVIVRLASIAQANALFGHFKKHGILVRPMSGYHLPDCLRITIGLEPSMQAVFGALNDFDWNG